MKLRTVVLFTLGIAAILFLPWLGVTDFYSKGEPREAIVAVSMIDSGDWILPVSYGEDIPYKPPLLAWLIAIFSLLFNGGVVSEFTSRLPSALAATALLTATAVMVYRYRGAWRALVTVVLTATAFEVMRAAEACRVDMLLTAFTCCGLYALFLMRHSRWWALPAILLLSGAALAKGPVGVLLPCLAMGIYRLLARENFFRVFFELVAICLASCVLPAAWYYSAYLRGGDEFLQLMLEENIGRLTGTMSYDSHLNPWWYNVTSVLAGFLPWTLPALLSLLYADVRRDIADAWRSRSAGWGMFAMVSFATIFIFYCIPASKRSVYLLPCYPIAAYALAWLLMKTEASRIMRWWTGLLVCIAVLAPIVFVVAALGWLPGSKLAQLHWWLWPLVFAPAVVALWLLRVPRQSASCLTKAMILTVTIFVAYNAAYMPMILNHRSDMNAVRIIGETVPSDAPIVSVIEEDRLMRYYSINFYLDDRLRRSTSMQSAPDDAWILTGSDYGTDVFERRDSLRLSVRESDTRRPLFLLSPVRRSPQ